MNAEARTVSVHILGREYRIRSTEDGDFVREVARYVDELMRQISAKMTSGTTTQIAVLAALNVAEELFRQRRDGGGDVAPSELESRMRGVLKRLDEIVDPERKGDATDSVSTPLTSR
jgi:cell division protein ZapA